jgi:hypothetical protein
VKGNKGETIKFLSHLHKKKTLGAIEVIPEYPDYTRLFVCLFVFLALQPIVVVFFTAR